MRAIGGILAATILVMGLSACNRAPEPAAQIAPDPAAALAKWATVATDDIAENPELLPIAMSNGKTLFEANCASCHGADLKGIADQHTPNLTDDFWTYAGDDLDSGGVVHKASDVEKTIANGIRSHPRVSNPANQQEADAQNLPYKTLTDMPPIGPGLEYDLNDDEKADVVEFVMQISGRDHDMAKATRGKALFADKGGCYDCHGEEGDGDSALGSTNLQKPELYLYGSSREEILASMKSGSSGVSPAFADKLKPEEIKALSVYVFSQGGPGTLVINPR